MMIIIFNLEWLFQSAQLGSISESEHGGGGGEDGAEGGNGGSACGLFLLFLFFNLGIAVIITVAGKLDRLWLPSEVGIETVSLLEHHVFNRRVELLRHADWAGTGTSIGDDLSLANLDCGIRCWACAGAEAGSEDDLGCIESYFRRSCEPMAFGT